MKTKLTTKTKSTKKVNVIKKLKGCFKEPENFDYKTELTEAINKKYNNI